VYLITLEFVLDNTDRRETSINSHQYVSTRKKSCIHQKHPISQGMGKKHPSGSLPVSLGILEGLQMNCQGFFQTSTCSVLLHSPSRGSLCALLSEMI